MKKILDDLSYAEQIEAALGWHGFLDPADVVRRNARYIAQAEDCGMTPFRCAKNIMDRWPYVRG